MTNINQLSNAIYLPRVKNRTRIIRQKFEDYRAGLFEDPRPTRLQVLFCGIGFGFLVCVPIIIHLLPYGK